MEVQIEICSSVRKCLFHKAIAQTYNKYKALCKNELIFILTINIINVIIQMFRIAMIMVITLIISVDRGSVATISWQIVWGHFKI